MHPLTTLKYAHQTLLDAVKALDDSDWDAPGVCGFWSVKQIIGHIVGWDAFFYEFLAPYAGESISVPHVDDFDAMNFDEDKFNDKYGTSASSCSREDLLSALEETYHRSLEICGRITDETWHRTGVMPWAPAGDLEDYLLYAVYGHHYEHAAQIVVFRDRHLQKKG